MPDRPSGSDCLLARDFDRYRNTRDSDALARVVEQTEARLLRIARRRCSLQDAEDVVQATYVTAIERAQSFDATRRLLPWLVAILESRIGSLGGHSDAEDFDLDAVVATDERSTDPTEWAESRELRAELERAFTTLSVEEREAIHLRYFHDLKPSEIARAKAQKASTVRMRLARSLRWLGLRLPAGLSAGLFAWLAAPVHAAVGVMRGAAQAGSGTSRGARQAFATSLVLTGFAIATAAWLWSTGFVAPGVSVPTAHPQEVGALAAGRIPDQPATDGATNRSLVDLGEPRGESKTEWARVQLTWSDDGSPVAHTRVRIKRNGISRAVGFQDVETDADGWIDFGGRSACEYSIVLGSRELGRVRVDDDGRTAEVVEAGALMVDSLAPIDLRVLDELGRAVAGAVIHCARVVLPVGTTGEDGAVRLARLLVADQVHAVVPGRGVTDCVSLGSGAGGSTIELRLPRSRFRVVGRLIDQNGAAVAGAGVKVQFETVEYQVLGERPYGRSRAPNHVTESAVDGTFSFDCPAACAELAIVVEGEDAVGVGRVDPREKSSFDVRIDRGHLFAGVVVDSDNRPVPGAAIRVRPADRRWNGVRQAVTDPDGAFALAACPHGPVDLSVDGGEAGFLFRSFELIARDTDVRLALTPRSPITGTFRDPEDRLGLGQTRLRIEVYPEGEEDRPIVIYADADGSFRTQPAWSGPSTIVVMRSPSVMPIAERTGVLPGERVEFDFAPTMLPTGSVRARLDPSLDKAAVRIRTLSVTHERGTNRVRRSDEGFYQRYLPAGRYQILEIDEHEELHVLREFDLAEGEEVDLGLIRSRGR